MNVTLLPAKRLCRYDSVTDLEVERLSWVILVGPKCNHKCPYKKGAEVNFIQKADGDMQWPQKGIQRCYAAGFEDEGRGPEPRNAALESGNVKEIHSLLGLLLKLILGLQNCKIISFLLF